MRKSVFWISDQVRHKPAIAATESSKRLEISDIETRDIILSRQTRVDSNQPAQPHRLARVLIFGSSK